ncbi:MAG: hypothetical protein VYA54_02540 [Bdellovibrionota bacterium]|nr:hypothetical protein [Bdellovibrionota bacterium]
MDNFWRFNLNVKGQSTVEYILVLAVVISMSLLVFRSNGFKNLFGENGRFSDVYKRQMEYSYRHGRPGDERFRTPNYGSDQHDSYNGRLFVGTDPYPSQ